MKIFNDFLQKFFSKTKQKPIPPKINNNSL